MPFVEHHFKDIRNRLEDEKTYKALEKLDTGHHILKEYDSVDFLLKILCSASHSYLKKYYRLNKPTEFSEIIPRNQDPTFLPKLELRMNETLDYLVNMGSDETPTQSYISQQFGS